MSFTGFSEEDLKRIKSSESGPNSGPKINLSNVKRIDKIGSIPKRAPREYKLPTLKKQNSDEAMDVAFEKCKLSLKSNQTSINNNEIENGIENTITENEVKDEDHEIQNNLNNQKNLQENEENMDNMADIDYNNVVSRKNSANVSPDVVQCLGNYTEDELAAHRLKLEDLQLKQKLMEEQNKKRKEMLARALADRTKQTEAEVVRLEKIKKELQILDGQFSVDVAVLRKKIDQACLSYADAEKHYLRVEKEFLQAKINLQKEKEKKELLTEHLCALITHNETRKAHKLETLMLELATDKQKIIEEMATPRDREVSTDKNEIVDEMATSRDSDAPIVIDGVDENGKMVEIVSGS